MELELSEEHEAFRTGVRRFMTERAPIGEVRAVMESDHGYDPAVWDRMADQLGLQALIIPEEHGGAGFGFVELGIVLEETGRALLGAPYLATVLATLAVLNSEDDAAQKRYLPLIAAGTVATLALADDSARWPPTADGLVARRLGTGVVLDGHRSYVLVTGRPGTPPRATRRPGRVLTEPA